jgi:hypothetical protein
MQSTALPLKAIWRKLIKTKTPQSLAGPVLYRIRFYNLSFSITCPAISIVTLGTKPIL